MAYIGPQPYPLSGVVKQDGSTPMYGNLVFSGNARRISGDYHNAIRSNRVLIQDATPGNQTSVGAIPNGAFASQFVAWGGPDADNAPYTNIQSDPTGGLSSLSSGATGTGVVPTALAFNVGGAERLRILAGGMLQSSNFGFQCLTANTATYMSVSPNGTSTSTGLTLYNNSSAANAGYVQLVLDTSAAYLIAGKSGTGSYVPLTFQAGGAERYRINTAGRNLFNTTVDNGISNVQVAGGLFLSSAFDSAGAQIRLNGGGADAMFRTDTSNFYLLLTNGANQSYNAARPFSVAFATGAVTIDGTNAGCSFGGGASFAVRPTFAGKVPWDNGNRTNPANCSTANAVTFAWNTPIANATNLTIDAAAQGAICIGDGDYRWHYAGQGGTPAWVWGSATGKDMYVYQPSNFTVYSASVCTTANGLAGDVNGGLLSLSAVRCSATAGNIAGRGGGAYMGWNESGGQGEGVMTANNAGSAGGWAIRTVNSNNSAEVGRFVISPSGTGTNGSDRRLKENIVPLEDALDKVCQLQGVSFDYITSGEKHYGLIAQDVQPLFPDAVTTPGAGPGKEDYLGIAYTDLIAPLVEAIKTLTARVIALESAAAPKGA